MAEPEYRIPRVPPGLKELIESKKENTTMADDTTLDWDAAQEPIPDLVPGAAFQAGYAVALYGGRMVQDRAADHMEDTHTFSISPAHLDVMEATAAKCGYRMIVLDPGKFNKNGKAHKRATLRFTRNPFVGSEGWVKVERVSLGTLKERLEAKACPHCGSPAVAQQVTYNEDGSFTNPVKHCQACDETWSDS